MHDRSARFGYLALVLSLAVGACSSDDDGAAGSAGKTGTASGGTSATSGGDAGASASGKGGRAGGSTGGKGSGGAGGKGSAATGGKGGGSTGPVAPGEWVNATGNLANMKSECGNLTLLSAVPGSDTIIAGVAQKGLFASIDGGEHWEPLGTGAGSAVITNRPSSIVYDPEQPDTFWESGIYNGGGVYKTTDAGVTFKQLGDVSHNDLVSVDFSDPERKTLLVGGHEQKQKLYFSTNGGDSFSQIGDKLPANSHFSSNPLLLDAQTFLLGSCGYGDGECGVYRSSDAGEHWDRVSDLAAAARPLVASDGSIYWSLIYNSGLARGTADGSSFTKTSDGIVSAPPVELPDGRILTVKGDHVAVSDDQGTSWNPIGDKLPFQASGVVYSEKKKMLFTWHWDCGEIVLPDAIASAGFE